MSIEGIGDITTEGILQYRMDNLDLILDLVKELEFIEEKKKDISDIQDTPLKNAKVYPTGKFSFKKDELKAKLEELGATVTSGYAKSLDYLICGGDTSKSGKVDKARKDGVNIMLEEEMMKYF
jgi:NAD-dependent DNA ligase